MSLTSVRLLIVGLRKKNLHKVPMLRLKSLFFTRLQNRMAHSGNGSILRQRLPRKGFLRRLDKLSKQHMRKSRRLYQQLKRLPEKPRKLLQKLKRKSCKLSWTQLRWERTQPFLLRRRQPIILNSTKMVILFNRRTSRQSKKSGKTNQLRKKYRMTHLLRNHILRRIFKMNQPIKHLQRRHKKMKLRLRVKSQLKAKTRINRRCSSFLSHGRFQASHSYSDTNNELIVAQKF